MDHASEEVLQLSCANILFYSTDASPVTLMSRQKKQMVRKLECFEKVPGFRKGRSAAGP